MRRLVENQGARLGLEFGEARAPGLGARRQEPLEAESVRGLGGDRERGNGGTGTRHRDDFDSRGGGGPHQLEPRIADGRRSRVAHQGDGRPAAHHLDQFGRAMRLVVIVQRDQRRRDAGALQERAGMPCVLGRDQCAFGERRARARAQVAQIADWRRHHV